MKTDKKTIGVDAVNKALEILNCFTEKNEALTITKIANITGDHKSRISRISKSKMVDWRCYARLLKKLLLVDTDQLAYIRIKLLWSLRFLI